MVMVVQHGAAESASRWRPTPTEPGNRARQKRTVRTRHRFGTPSGATDRRCGPALRAGAAGHGLPRWTAPMSCGRSHHGAA